MLLLKLEKNGKICKTSMDKIDETQLYLKAGKVNPDGFDCKLVLQKGSFSVKLFGKLEGRKNQDHMVEGIRFFGPVILVAVDLNQNYIDLPISKWLNGDEILPTEIKKRKRSSGIPKVKPEVKIYTWKPELEKEEFL